MASLSVRRIDDNLYERLKHRAAQHGVSMEEEVRQILQREVAAPRNLAELALECFGEENGVDLELPPREIHEPLDLGE